MGEAVAERTLDGAELRAMIETATRWLERNAEAVNAINVFPVPDGDTGTNMALTMRATIDATPDHAEVNIAEVTRSMSRGALMGARGNSGVILSQFVRGLAGNLDVCERVGGVELARALRSGAANAYAALTNPVEGTILTVMRAGGEGADAAINSGTTDVTEVMAAAVAATREAVEHTPDLLPVLREAGVVDSGGLGFHVLLDGALRALRGEPLPDAVAEAGQIAADWLSSAGEGEGHGDGYGYCTEFVVSGDEVPLEVLRSRLQSIGDSVLVVGDPALVRIHIHIDDPGRALSIGAEAGRLSNVKVDDMEAQADRLASRLPPTGPLSIVAVGAGRGLVAMLRDVGAERVITGGQTMNPSAEEILRAVQATHGERVIVLPNNKNIIWTAEQAATMADKPVSVLPTRSIPQGIAAILAVNPDAELETNLAAMREAAAAVRTIEVTRAARGVRIGGVAVDQDQPIALIDDELRIAAATPEDAAIQAVQALEGGGGLITLYWGRDTEPERAQSLAARLREQVSGAEVEAHDGGQPFYDYVLSVE